MWRAKITTSWKVRTMPSDSCTISRRIIDRMKLATLIAAILGVSVGIGGVAPNSHSASDAQPKLPSNESLLQPGVPVVVTVPAPDVPRFRSVLISLKDPGRI